MVTTTSWELLAVATIAGSPTLNSSILTMKWCGYPQIHGELLLKMGTPPPLDLARSTGVSCLSITDPGDSDIIRTLPGQVEPEFQLVKKNWIGEHPFDQ
jgi:hypothetical protein